MNIRTCFAVIPLLIGLPFSALEAQGTFSPDRPGLGSGSYVLSPKVTYLESGFEYFDSGPVEEFSIGQVFVRHGLTPGVELRVLLNSLILRNAPLVNQSGVPDPGVSMKVTISDKPWSSLRVAGLGTLTIPAGSSDFTSDEWIPSFYLLADYGLSEFWAISSNLGYTFGPGQLEGVWTITATPGFTVPGNSGLGIYFGYAGFYSDSADEHFAEAGAAKRVSENLQLDLNGGLDLNSGYAFVGAGAVLRF